jgi:hypothetical protein
MTSNETKPLYVLTIDGGDGSTSTRFTFDSKLIAKLCEAEENGTLPYYMMDGDGFHYRVLTVPMECTYASLGVSYPFTCEIEEFDEDYE